MLVMMRKDFFEDRCCGMMMGVVCKVEELIFIGR
jgi:hypothetical protein